MILKIFCILSTICFVKPQNGVSDGINKFMAHLMQNIDQENFVISPFSLHSTFSQALVGAGGKTQTELEEVLGVTRSRSLADQYSRIHENLSYLKIANMLVLNKGFEPKALFINFLQKGFGTQMKEYDFYTEKDKSVREINNIVESQTNQRITDLISPEAVDGNLKMMMINAVYFKAKWKQAFNTQDSFTSRFQSPKMGNVMTKFMTAEMEARFDETDDLDILELPYEDSSKSMIIFLPKSDEISDHILHSIQRYPTQEIKSIRTNKATVSIPKFEINFQMDLKSKMNKMGAFNMFSEKANFSYITNKPLQVSDGIHKAFIEVNEEGTEAAAATAVLFSFKSAGRQKRFFANRPFYFMVYDFHNQFPIFIGKLSNPSSKIETETKTTIRKKTATKEAEPNNVLQTNEINQVSEQQIKLNEECQPYFETFGLVHNNNKECTYKGYRPYGWFVKNNSVCMKSQKLYREFSSKNCGPAWCDYAQQNYKDWKQKYARECLPQNGIFKTASSTNCIKLESNLKAKTFLSCKL